MCCWLVPGLLILVLNNGLAHGQVNIALNHTASSSSVFSENGNTYGPASKVVDGNRDPFLNGFSCLLTERRVTSLAWLYIDLGNMSVVHRIEMTNRRGGSNATSSAAKDKAHRDKLKGFGMAVSSTTTMPPSQSDVCYKHPGTDRPTVFQNRTCNQIGRYVIIYNDRTNEMEICEVDVIGCPVGYHGKNCSLPCGDHCVGAQCLPNNGSCMFGCIQGFRGDRCIKECNEGTYGWNCNQTCGNCSGSDVCDHETGDCPGTCSNGYKGQKCDHANGSNRTKVY
ncbi:uncharacterized protein LOC117326570 [Pecten maximus]|uniref:uncharacterized protein LOC117326570 n=1 Tax=Pecten maximus TaxID=6579 RepID=UPI00145840C9|nr:uncharacterized protein LOC117326570 [Pecten maximus]